MATPDLEMLSTEALLDLTAQLDAELAGMRLRLHEEFELLGRNRQTLIEPGVKLALNGTVGLTGLAFAQITSGWTLIATVITVVILISDTAKFTDDVSEFRAVRRRVRLIRESVRAILGELEEIRVVLLERHGNPAHEGG